MLIVMSIFISLIPVATVLTAISTITISPLRFTAPILKRSEFISGGTIKEIDLVLAGDIFEITRSALWHQDHLKPYLHNDEILEGSDAEKRVLEVIDSIARMNALKPRLMSLLVYDYFQLPVYIHFVPGNHDRLANSSPNIRKGCKNY